MMMITTSYCFNVLLFYLLHIHCESKKGTHYTLVHIFAKFLIQIIVSFFSQIIASFSVFNISQGSVATHLR